MSDDAHYHMYDGTRLPVSDVNTGRDCVKGGPSDGNTLFLRILKSAQRQNNSTRNSKNLDRFLEIVDGDPGGADNEDADGTLDDVSGISSSDDECAALMTSLSISTDATESVNATNVNRNKPNGCQHIQWRDSHVSAENSDNVETSGWSDNAKDGLKLSKCFHIEDRHLKIVQTRDPTAVKLRKTVASEKQDCISKATAHSKTLDGFTTASDLAATPRKISRDINTPTNSLASLELSRYGVTLVDVSPNLVRHRFPRNTQISKTRHKLNRSHFLRAARSQFCRKDASCSKAVSAMKNKLPPSFRPNLRYCMAYPKQCSTPRCYKSREKTRIGWAQQPVYPPRARHVAVNCEILTLPQSSDVEIQTSHAVAEFGTQTVTATKDVYVQNTTRSKHRCVGTEVKRYTEVGTQSTPNTSDKMCETSHYVVRLPDVHYDGTTWNAW